MTVPEGAQRGNIARERWEADEKESVFPPAAAGFPFTVGSFVLEGELGRGGMGIVYRGHDPGGRPIALKTPLVADPDRLQRFHLEARVLRRLRHPGVVVVLEHGDVAGWPYFVMEYVAGRPLNRALPWPPATATATATAADSASREAMTPSAAGARASRESFARFRYLVCRRMTELCEALHHVHGHGLVHRDLKPGNVLVTEDGAVKLMDFGLVSAASAGLNLTVPGQLLGTILYMSPEQISGQDVDLRADLYSVGVLLFELLTGRRPFDGESFGPILLGHLQVPPPDPFSLDARLDRPLADVILRCLQKRPEQRYQSARELCDKLREMGASGRKRRAAAAAGAGEAGPGPAAQVGLLAPAAAWPDEAAAAIAAAAGLVGRPGVSWAAVRGHPGTGKTRFLGEVARHAAGSSAMVLRTELRAGGGAPTAVFSELTAPITARLKTASAREVIAALGRNARLLEALIPGIDALPGVAALPVPVEAEPRQALARSLSYLGRVLRHLARERPIVLALDGLGHADLQTVEAIGAVARASAAPADGSAASCLVVGSWDSSPGEDRDTILQDLARVMGKPPSSAAHLGVLQVGDVERVLASMLGQDPPPGLVATAVEVSSGNAGALVEAMRLFELIGALRRAPQQGWVFDALATSALGHSQSVGDLASRLWALLRTRAGKLSETACTVLETASLLEGAVGVDLLMRIWEAGGGALAEGLDAVQELRERGLLREVSGGGYAVVPRVFAELLRAALDADRRVELHRRAARCLAGAGEATTLADALAAARHFAEAGDSQHAVMWYVNAARAGLAAFANEAAAAAFRRALELGKACLAPAEKAALCFELGRALDLAGRLSEALAEHSRARFLARGAGEALVGFQAGAARISLMARMGKADEAVVAAGAMECEEQAIADPGLRASYWTGVAAARLVRNELALARELHARALEARRSMGETRAVQQSLSNLGVIEMHLGEDAVAERRFRQALELTGGEETLEGAGIMVNLASLLQNRGELAKALPWYERALAGFRRAGVRLGEAVALGNLGQLQALSGHLDLAIDLLGQATGIDAELGPSRDALRRRMHLARVRGERGEMQRSRDELAEVAAEASRLGDATTSAESRFALARTAMVLRDYAAAGTELGALLSATTENGHRELGEIAVAARALALCIPGRLAPPAAAEPHALAELAERLGEPTLAIWALLAIGCRHLLDGQAAAAIDCFGRARHRSMSTCAGLLVLLALAGELSALTLAGSFDAAAAVARALEAEWDRLAESNTPETAAGLRRHPYFTWVTAAEPALRG
ncbi:MAG: protein kinase [Candidatus Schekmanbacteria bacterium]|nr:protein kinase [Candidatus Schekmanbacteria bacterium]